LMDDRQQMHDKILAEIKIAVTTTAKTSGCTLVIDTGAETASGTPAVLYDSGENDLTDAVLAQLNAGAPIDVTKPAANTNSANP
jgi:Skp family chaperone for outer membrane proteins